MADIDKQLLALLACPVCKNKLVLQKDKLLCKACHKDYPVQDGIPLFC